MPTLRLRVWFPAALIRCSAQLWHLPHPTSTCTPESFRVGKTVASRVADGPTGSRPVAPQVVSSGELVEEPWGLKGALTQRRGGGTRGEMREEEKG